MFAATSSGFATKVTPVGNLISLQQYENRRGEQREIHRNFLWQIFWQGFDFQTVKHFDQMPPKSFTAGATPDSSGT